MDELEEFEKQQQELLAVLSEEDDLIGVSSHREESSPARHPHEPGHTETLFKIISSILLICLLINTFFNIDVSYLVVSLITICFFLYSFKQEIINGGTFLYETSLKEMINKTYHKKSKEKLNLNPYKRRKNEFLSRRISKEELFLAKQDSCFSKEQGLINLRTKKEKEATRITFKVLVKIDEQEPISAEIDSCSHISLISYEYYQKYLKKGPVKFLNEPPTEYGGLGSELKSPYPPINLNFQIGGVQLSGRFIISKELDSSNLLLGSDLMFKYNISLVSHATGGWRVSIGKDPNILANVPCMVSKKLRFTSDLVKKISQGDIIADNFEDFLEPGYRRSDFDKSFDKEQQLLFIKNLKNIKEEIGRAHV